MAGSYAQRYARCEPEGVERNICVLRFGRQAGQKIASWPNCLCRLLLAARRPKSVARWQPSLCTIALSACDGLQKKRGGLSQMDHHRVRIGRIDGHNRRRPAAANVRIATPMRGEFEIVLKCPAHFRRRERRSVVEVNFRTQFEREGPGVIRDVHWLASMAPMEPSSREPTRPSTICSSTLSVLSSRRVPGSRDMKSEFSRARRTFWPLASGENIDSVGTYEHWLVGVCSRTIHSTAI